MNKSYEEENKCKKKKRKATKKDTINNKNKKRATSLAVRVDLRQIVYASVSLHLPTRKRSNSVPKTNNIGGAVWSPKRKTTVENWDSFKERTKTRTRTRRYSVRSIRSGYFQGKRSVSCHSFFFRTSKFSDCLVKAVLKKTNFLAYISALAFQNFRAAKLLLLALWGDFTKQQQYVWEFEKQAQQKNRNADNKTQRKLFQWNLSELTSLYPLLTYLTFQKDSAALRFVNEASERILIEFLAQEECLHYLKRYNTYLSEKNREGEKKEIQCKKFKKQKCQNFGSDLKFMGARVATNANYKQKQHTNKTKDKRWNSCYVVKKNLKTNNKPIRKPTQKPQISRAPTETTTIESKTKDKKSNGNSNSPIKTTDFLSSSLPSSSVSSQSSNLQPIVGLSGFNWIPILNSNLNSSSSLNSNSFSLNNLCFSANCCLPLCFASSSTNKETQDFLDSTRQTTTTAKQINTNAQTQHLHVKAEEMPPLIRPVRKEEQRSETNCYLFFCPFCAQTREKKKEETAAANERETSITRFDSWDLLEQHVNSSHRNLVACGQKDVPTEESNTISFFQAGFGAASAK